MNLSYFVNSDNQFGFKGRLSCSHAIFTVRPAVNHYTAHGSTENLFAADISKAFDRKKHNGRFVLKTNGSVATCQCLLTLENWFGKYHSCVHMHVLVNMRHSASDALSLYTRFRDISVA